VIVLDGWQDYARLFALAALLGAVGGLVFELLQTVRGRTGLIEKPARVGRSHVDLGVIASVIVGAVAAVAALWIFPPEVSTSVVVDGTTTRTTHYDLIKVVGLSLVIGSAGGSFLAAMQARALALVKSEQASTTKRVANDQLATIEAQIESGASPANLAGAVTAAKAAVAATGDSGPGNPSFADF
jgi:hypothetical protein